MAKDSARTDMEITAGEPRPRLRISIGAWRTLLLIGLVLWWEFYARNIGDPVMWAPPTQVVQALGRQIFGDPKVVSAIWLALFEISVAFTLSVVCGVVIGVAIGLSEFGRRALLPIVLLLYAIPQGILLPLFILLTGIGPFGKIVFGFTHGIFPILINTVAGMRGVNPLFLKSSQSMGASRLQTIRHVIFPHMVPAVFAGFRLAMTVTLLGVLIAELFVSISGIGYFTQVFTETFNPAPLFALIATLATMAIVLNELVRLVEARFTRWKH